jgi:DNA repair protein RadC
MLIADLPSHERPRERLLRLGAAALSDTELLAVMLRTGARGSSALEVAGLLLRRFGGLCALLSAGPHEVVAVGGIGGGKFAQLQAGSELARRALAETWQRGVALDTPQASGDYLRAWLGHHPYEVFGVLFLDSRHRVLASEELFRGTIDSTSVYPRELVRRALTHNAAAVILAHNHPSGVAEPSTSDLAITRRIADALALIDVRVLDHLIVGQGHCVSLADRGML